MSSCAYEVDNSEDENVSLQAANVETHDQLLEFLNEKYGYVEETPMMTLLVAGERKMVLHKYLISDEREISIDILFTEKGERILDPAFDLNQLPD